MRIKKKILFGVILGLTAYLGMMLNVSNSELEAKVSASNLNTHLAPSDFTVDQSKEINQISNSFERR
jgi:hypothetical protein